MRKPLAIELFAGRFGWGKGFVAEGWRVIGFDIVHEEWHRPVPEGCELALQDVLTLHGSQFRDADAIVASPPCQAYSYRAMPWKRAKALPPPSNELFEACFRIQREASESKGEYIPMTVENVKGAQPWVGHAKWHYGSFYLWGDVPALMPFSRVAKVSGLNWSGSDKPGYVAKAFNTTAQQRIAVKVPSDSGRSPALGNGTRFTTRDCGIERKQTVWFNDDKRDRKYGGDWLGSGTDCSLMRSMSSRSHARKAASAAIAEIPFELASHIARCFKP